MLAGELVKEQFSATKVNAEPRWGRCAGHQSSSTLQESSAHTAEGVVARIDLLLEMEQ